MDEVFEKAKEKIKKACGCENAEVYFLVGGTQTNQIIIDTTLKPYEVSWSVRELPTRTTE